MDLRSVALAVVSSVVSGKSLASAKKEAALQFGLSVIPTNIELLTQLTDEERQRYSFLLTKPMRTLSGVAPVAVMMKPLNCPHGKCSFCPGGPDSFFGNVPQSYTGYEPSTMRA